MNQGVFSHSTFRRWWLGMVNTVAHDEVIRQVSEDGRLTYSYAFMVVISAGIATIGLLLNSPAVIVGAMLVSPLMGPITLCGIAISTANTRRGGQSALTLLVGMGISLAVSIAIVYASPLNNVTPEILARTRPNLFDLLVAVFSGLAGGYAVIRGRGSAIVGVAIATALMPPLAVVGYGAAMAQWGIAKGAFLLFVTNMLAIGLSVAFVATWYGFGRRSLRQKLAWQTVLAALILVPLAMPLVTTLQTIAQESLTTNTARDALERLLSSKGAGRIDQFQVSFPKHQPVLVEALLLTPHPQAGLAQEAQNVLRQRLDQPVRVRLEQVPLSDGASSLQPTALTNPALSRLLPTSDVPTADALRKAFALPVRMMDIDAHAKRIRIMPEPGTDAPLSVLRQMEGELRRLEPGWSVTIIPPPQVLVPIQFAVADAVVGPEQQKQLNDIIWALHAWQVRRVQVVGLASTVGNYRGNAALARARAIQVASALGKAGIEAEFESGYPAPDQRQRERQSGYAAFRIAEVRIPAQP